MSDIRKRGQREFHGLRDRISGSRWARTERRRSLVGGQVGDGEALVGEESQGVEDGETAVPVQQTADEADL